MANMTFTIDDTTKRHFMHFCDDVGLSASSVITLYIKTVVRENRIPFAIEGSHVPNAETIAALEEGDRIVNDPNRKHFKSLDALWEDLER